jgi:hypothetical protein
MHSDFFTFGNAPPDQFLWLKRLAPIVLLAVFWCWETWRPYFGQGDGRWRHGARNLAIAVFNIVVLGLVFGSVTLAVAAWTEQKQYGLLNLFYIPPSYALFWHWYFSTAGCTAGIAPTMEVHSCGGSTECTIATGTWT